MAFVKNSHQRCSLRKGVPRNFAKFTGKHLCQSLFYNKVAGRGLHRCFPVNFAKFLRTPFLQNTSGRLLLFCELSLVKIYFQKFSKNVLFTEFSVGIEISEISLGNAEFKGAFARSGQHTLRAVSLQP